jgi:simple sugar transport system ATP-binding protein
LRSKCKHRFGFDWRSARERTRQLIGQFDVRVPSRAASNSPDRATAASLSGGNQQKVIIARALTFPHTAIAAADPTRGLDIGATTYVREQLRRAADEGAGVLLISTDLDEIMELCDRIGVLYEGRLLPDENLLPASAGRAAIGALMGGHEVQRGEAA